MQRYWYRIAHLDASMWIYCLMWSTVSFSAFGVQAVLLNLYLVHLGYDAARIGQLLAVSQLVFGLAAIPSGFMGARLGPRSGLLTGTAAMAGGWTIFLLAEALPAGGLPAALMVGLCASWAGQAFLIVNGAPYFMGITTPEYFAYDLSLQQVIQAITALVGGLLAGALPGLLAQMAGGIQPEAAFYRSVLWLIPVAFFLSFLSLFRARPVTLQIPAADDTPLPPRRFPWGPFCFYTIAVLFIIIGDTGARTFFNLYLADIGLSTSQIGTLVGITQLAPLVISLVIPLALNRIGVGMTFSLGGLCLAASALFLTVSAAPPVASAGWICVAIMSTVMNTTRSVFGQQLVEPRWRTYIAAAGTIAMSLGSAISAAVGGAIIPQLGFHSLFRFSAALAFLSGVISLGYLRLKEARAANKRYSTAPTK